jgi:uncharacterized membrane protein
MKAILIVIAIVAFFYSVVTNPPPDPLGETITEQLVQMQNKQSRDLAGYQP